MRSLLNSRGQILTEIQPNRATFQKNQNFIFRRKPNSLTHTTDVQEKVLR
jgi:hypothetical protein